MYLLVKSKLNDMGIYTGHRETSMILKYFVCEDIKKNIKNIEHVKIDKDNSDYISCIIL